MFTESRVVLQERLFAVEQHMPPDGETLQGTFAAEVLAPLDERQLKELANFGIASLLRGMRPHIPFIENPDTDVCRDTLAQLYIQENKFSKSPFAKGIFSLSHETLSEFIAPTVRTYLNGVPVDALRAIKAVETEMRSRYFLKLRGERCDSLFIDNTRSIEGITYQISGNAWGASRQIVSELYERVGGVIERNGSVEPDQFLQLSPHIRSLIGGHDFKSYTRAMTGLSLNHVVVILSEGRMTEGYNNGSLDMPNIPEAVRHYSTDSDRDTIAVGCPASFVKGMVAWAPQMMLSACEAIAANPPIPTSY